jgi:hypothetical protein
VVEINQAFGKGTLLGKIGLFTPDGKRTKTVRCKTDDWSPSCIIFSGRESGVGPGCATQPGP